MSGLIANLQEYWMVHLLLVLYTALMVYHGWKGNRETKGIADYYVGGRNMGGLAIGLSFFATYSSTNSFVGFSGQAYNWGVPWLLLLPFVVGFCLLAWVVVAPRLRYFTESLNSLTLPDFIGFRFASNKARVLAAIIVIFASFFYMTAVFKGIGNLIEVFLKVPYWLAILIVFLIVMIYTVLGGFISVVKTDAIQAIVMIIAAFLLFSGTIEAAGGIGSFFDVRNQPGGSRLFTWDAGVAFPILIGTLFAGTIKFAVDPRQLSRFYALKGRRELKTGIWVSTATFALVYALLVPIGIYARRIFPEGNIENDLVVPQLLGRGEVFSDGVSAFLLLAMVAAAMSSLDSVLLVMASTAERDIVGILKRSSTEKSAVKATRFYVALFATITMVISLNPPGSIVVLTSFSGALYAACFFPALILGLYWRRGSGSAVLASFAAGVGALLLWKYVPGGKQIHEVFPALFLSLLVYIIVSLRTDMNQAEGVKRLFSGRGGAASDCTS